MMTIVITIKAINLNNDENKFIDKFVGLYQDELAS
jgi:hypothetical protein